MYSLLMNVFFRYTVSYYLFVWMCHGRTLYNRIFRLYEKFIFIIIFIIYNVWIYKTSKQEFWL